MKPNQGGGGRIKIRLGEGGSLVLTLRAKELWSCQQCPPPGLTDPVTLPLLFHSSSVSACARGKAGEIRAPPESRGVERRAKGQKTAGQASLLSNSHKSASWAVYFQRGAQRPSPLASPGSLGSFNSGSPHDSAGKSFLASSRSHDFWQLGPLSPPTRSICQAALPALPGRGLQPGPHVSRPAPGRPRPPETGNRLGRGRHTAANQRPEERNEHRGYTIVWYFIIYFVLQGCVCPRIHVHTHVCMHAYSGWAFV